MYNTKINHIIEYDIKTDVLSVLVAFDKEGTDTEVQEYKLSGTELTHHNYVLDSSGQRFVYIEELVKDRFSHLIAQ